MSTYEEMHGCCRATIKLTEPSEPKCMCDSDRCNADHGPPFYKCVICGAKWAEKTITTTEWVEI